MRLGKLKVLSMNRTVFSSLQVLHTPRSIGRFQTLPMELVSIEAEPKFQSSMQSSDFLELEGAWYICSANALSTDHTSPAASPGICSISFALFTRLRFGLSCTGAEYAPLGDRIWTPAADGSGSRLREMNPSANALAGQDTVAKYANFKILVIP